MSTGCTHPHNPQRGDPTPQGPLHESPKSGARSVVPRRPSLKPARSIVFRRARAPFQLLNQENAYLIIPVRVNMISTSLNSPMKLTPTASVLSFEIGNTAPKIMFTNVLVRNTIVHTDFVLVPTLSLLRPTSVSPLRLQVLRFLEFALHYHVVDDAYLCCDLIHLLDQHT